MDWDAYNVEADEMKMKELFGEQFSSWVLGKLEVLILPFKR